MPWLARLRLVEMLFTPRLRSSLVLFRSWAAATVALLCLGVWSLSQIQQIDATVTDPGSSSSFCTVSWAHGIDGQPRSTRLFMCPAGTEAGSTIVIYYTPMWDVAPLWDGADLSWGGEAFWSLICDPAMASLMLGAMALLAAALLRLPERGRHRPRSP